MAVFVSSMLSTPFIINTWFAGKIVSASPGCRELALGLRHVRHHHAGRARAGDRRLFTSTGRPGRRASSTSRPREPARRAAEEAAPGASEDTGRYQESDVLGTTSPKVRWTEAVQDALVEIDAFGWCFSEPAGRSSCCHFSLKTCFYADGGWRNASMIAMMVVGGVPSNRLLHIRAEVGKDSGALRPRLIFNKTFVMAIIIDGFYLRKRHCLNSSITPRAHTDFQLPVI